MTDNIDPIEEIHEIRKAMYAKTGGTPPGFVRYLRKLEKERGKHVAVSPARKTGKRGKNTMS